MTTLNLEIVFVGIFLTCLKQILLNVHIHIRMPIRKRSDVMDRDMGEEGSVPT